MNLNVSLNNWIDHIITLLNKNNNDTNYRYKGAAINGFKNSYKTKTSAQFIEQHFNTTIDVTNMDEILIRLINQCEPAEFSRATTNFIKLAIQNKFLISKTINANQIENLSSKIEAAESAYNDLEIDEYDENEADTGNHQNNINNEENENVTVNQQTNNNNDQRFVINDTITLNDETVGSQQFTQQFLALKTMLENTLHGFGEQIKNLKEQQSTGYENKSLGELLGLLSFRFNKLLKLQHTKKLQQQYINENTIPNALAIDRFFRPMKCTTNLLTKMDEIYLETIKKISNAIIDDTEKSIEKIQEDILNIKTSLEHFKSKDEINKLCEEFKETETKKLKFRFDTALKRGKKSKVISFLNYYKDQIEDDPLAENNFSETASSISNVTNNSSHRINSKSNKTQQNNRPPSILRNNSKQRSRSNSRIRFKNQNNNAGINNNNQKQQFNNYQQKNNNNYNNNNKNRNKNNYNNYNNNNNNNNNYNNSNNNNYNNSNNNNYNNINNNNYDNSNNNNYNNNKNRNSTGYKYSNNNDNNNSNRFNNYNLTKNQQSNQNQRRQ